MLFYQIINSYIIQLYFIPLLCNLLLLFKELSLMNKGFTIKIRRYFLLSPLFSTYFSFFIKFMNFDLKLVTQVSCVENSLTYTTMGYCLSSIVKSVLPRKTDFSSHMPLSTSFLSHPDTSLSISLSSGIEILNFVVLLVQMDTV